MNEWTIDVDGDAKIGWIVAVHDGDNFAAYSPVAADADLARNMARDEHMKRFFPKQIEADAPAEPLPTTENATFAQTDMEQDRPQPEPKSVEKALAGVGITHRGGDET